MSKNTQQYDTCKKLFIIQLLLCISCRVGKGKQIEKQLNSLFVTCLVQCTCTISIQNPFVRTILSCCGIFVLNSHDICTLLSALR